MKVINVGCNYPYYAGWFEKNAPELAVHYAFSKSLTENGMVGTVKKIATHGEFNRTLYAIEVAGELGAVYLIGEGGIERA